MRTNNLIRGDNPRLECGIKKEMREMLPVVIFKESFLIRETQSTINRMSGFREYLRVVIPSISIASTTGSLQTPLALFVVYHFFQRPKVPAMIQWI
ncbi:hypothetical protein E2562_008687 [Oryza meyeriana var. granulata]|uniref:Uncharacterized protein n=1 Tax=Oryza meyeriana var. granulata TaxID=110450 RepID=A0A6G1F5G1_9ORYZ|nr:hypothetical protein E2562_008687 [Oryza meyeriana var. granulata]